MKLLKLRRGLDGQTITLDPLSTLGLGGEATVYSVPHDPALVAKVYHRPAEAHGRKLLAMLAHSPVDPVVTPGCCSIAWPVDLLYSPDRKRRIAGFLMPRMSGMSPVIDVYSPHSRLQQRPWFTYQDLVRTGCNLARVVSAIHASGYVIGDLNHTNVLVSQDALVTLIDTDSFQVRDPENGALYPCAVYTPEFTPPELQGNDSSQVERTPQHDCFGLAVLVFLLLAGGVHPFAGAFQDEGDPPPLADRIAAGHFPYSRGRELPYLPPVVAYPFQVLAPGLQRLFIQCFEAGHHRPEARPSAQDWRDGLLEAEAALVTCPANQQHRYGDHLDACPWCQRAAQLGGRDPFPSLGAIESARHVRPIPVTRTLPEGHTAAWQSQQEKIRPVAVTLGLPPCSRVWVALALTLWLGAPAMWGLIAMTFPPMLLIFAILVVILYTTTAAFVPLAVATVGWRRTLSLAKESRWVAVSALGVVAGAAMIALISFLTIL